MGSDPTRAKDRRGAFRESWRDFITSGIPEDPFSPYMRRVRFLNQFLLVTVVALLIFGAFNFFRGSVLGALIEIAIGAAGAATLLYIRRTGNLDRAQQVTLSMMLVMMIFLLMTGGIDGTGIFWWFTIPAGAFFMGRRFARLWMAGTIALIPVLMALSALGLIHPPYSIGFLRQFLASLIVVSLLIYFYEAIREDYEELIERHSREVVSANVRLTQEIAERRRVQDDLEAARREADRANQAKSEFLSRMSHELRTPLNSILGFSQLLDSDLSEPLTPSQRENVQLILAGGRHLLSLINEILDLSRIEAGRVTLSIEPLDARALVAETLAVVKPLAEERGIALRDETADAQIPKVVADSHRLKQILLNFLSNAIKYNREKGLVVVEAAAQKAGTLRLSVTDSGVGIPPEKQHLLFEPFQRLSAERTGIEGTGIGLTIARKLTEMMGGSIGLTSTPGLGSCFYVDLPAEQAAEASPQQPLALEEVPLPSRTDVAPGTGGTVLYIEDDQANLILARHVLARRPTVQLLTASRGDEGLDLARAHRPGLILLDIHLPDMDGHEIFRRLRSLQETAAIPVVIVSASAMPADIEKLLQEGASGYLTKPFDLSRFLAAVDEHLGSARSQVTKEASP